MKNSFIFLFICCIAWISIHICRYNHHPVPFINDYVTDFIAVPAMAHLTLIFTRIFIVRNKHYTYPLIYLLFIALYTSFIFEWVMPHISSRFTGDKWDVAAYFTGSIFYYFFHV